MTNHYIQHIIKGEILETAKKMIMQAMENNDILIGDFRMCTERYYPRETQSQSFGNTGMTNLGFLRFFLNENKKIVPDIWIFNTEDKTEDGYQFIISYLYLFLEFVFL